MRKIKVIPWDWHDIYLVYNWSSTSVVISPLITVAYYEFVFFSLIGYDLLALVKLVKLSLVKLKDIKLQTNLLTVEKTSKIFH